MESMGLAAGVYAGETCDMLMPPVNRLLSVHTFVLDEIDPDGICRLPLSALRRPCRADLQKNRHTGRHGHCATPRLSSASLLRFFVLCPNQIQIIMTQIKRYCMDDGVDAAIVAWWGGGGGVV